MQRVDMAALQAAADKAKAYITVDALPGTFVGPGRALAYVKSSTDISDDLDVLRKLAQFATALE